MDAAVAGGLRSPEGAPLALAVMPSTGRSRKLSRIVLATVPTLLALVLFSHAPAGAAPGQAGDAAANGAVSTLPAGAGVSIVRGRAARIADWPWQVAIALRRPFQGRNKPLDRTFCGGAVLAPRLVVTAGHCVSFLGRPKAKRIEVISGRTWLNRKQAGETVPVKNVLMPRAKGSGKALYRESGGSAAWDVALLTLERPVKAEPIRLAGPDEAEAWAPGHLAWTTGWGVRTAADRNGSPGLRMARQVMLAGRVCRLANGRDFIQRLMNCAGGPAGSASSCSGDSGGPLVVRVRDGYRLAGLTSWGDGACRGSHPSVYTRVAENPVRNWVASTALRLTGVDVVGSGGEVAPAPEWCRVPRVWGLTVRQARNRLRRNGCALGRVGRSGPWQGGQPGRIAMTVRFPGWLAPPGYRLRVWVRR